MHHTVLTLNLLGGNRGGTVQLFHPCKKSLKVRIRYVLKGVLTLGKQLRVDPITFASQPDGLQGFIEVRYMTQHRSVTDSDYQGPLTG